MKIDKYEYKGQQRKIYSQWESGQWYKILSPELKVIGVYNKAPNVCDTTHKVLKALQRMGFSSATGYQATDLEFARECKNKIHCFYNLWNEALDLTLYQIAENGEAVTVFYGNKSKSWKIDKDCGDYAYKILKTKIKTNGNTFEEFLTDVCEKRSPFNSWSILGRQVAAE